MSGGLSALASYAISDEEDAERDSAYEHAKGEELEEAPPAKVQDEEKKELKVPDVDNEDIWIYPEDEPQIEEDEEEKEKENRKGKKKDEEADDLIKDVDDLYAVHEFSEEEDDAGEGESSGAEKQEMDSLGEAMKVKARRRSKRSSSENAMNLAKKLRITSSDEVLIPPEPEGRCSSRLQDKISRYMERKVKHGEDLNRSIHERKDFRNPSIYEKLILHLAIEELGTNFPPEDYAPKVWRKVPAYDELARAQREDVAKREKVRKTMVEFVTGTVKKSSASSTSQPSSSSERFKKTKWDQQTSSKSDK